MPPNRVPHTEAKLPAGNRSGYAGTAAIEDIDAADYIMLIGTNPRAEAPVLKIKLDDHLPFEKLAAIRAARPDAQLVVDANQGWSFDLLQEVLPKCASLDLAMIEQPLARGADDVLEGF